MKSFILSLTCCIFFTTSLRAQKDETNNPVAKEVNGGVWVYLGNRIPKDFSYQIERKKENDRAFEKLGVVKAPTSEKEAQARQKDYSGYFDALEPVVGSHFQKLWSYIQSHPVTDSMQTGNLPLCHLIIGTAYFDSKAEKNTNYIYRVTINNTTGDVVSQKETNPTASFKKSVLPKIAFSEKRYAAGKLSITWGYKDLPSDMAYFNVYRSVYGKEDFKKTIADKTVFYKKDSVMLMVIDSLGDAAAWYDYRITAVDAYGEEGPMQANTDGGNIREYYAPPVTNFKAESTGQNHLIKLSWKFENKRYLNGIDVMRSNRYDDGFTRIATLPVTENEYLDVVPVSGENYYYYLLLLSADNKPIPTAKVFGVYTNDKEKPAAPQEIDAEQVSGGIKIHWANEEPFVKGYYVYRRINSEEPFVQVSPMISGEGRLYAYLDTSASLLAGEVYQYVVRAMGENKQLSENSETASAAPGKKLSLTPPMNIRLRTNGTKVTLIWDDMTRWINNLLGYKVYRKSGKDAWKTLENDSITATKNFFDDNIDPGVSYTYGISAYDYYGNESERTIVEVPATVVATPIPVPPAGLTTTQVENSVHLTWGQTDENVRQIRIYRFEPGVAAKQIAVVDDEDYFVDKTVVAGKLYFYQITSVNKDSKESEKSEKISIRIIKR